jgi:site-specific DNA-methyltransferase (adenine-specific)
LQKDGDVGESGEAAHEVRKATRDKYMNKIYFGDNLPILQSLPSESIQLIYIDPPFNTGKSQARTQIKTIRDENGDRVGFKGQRYKTEKIISRAYADVFDDFLGFLEPRLVEAKRVLTPNGSMYFHIDYREVHYCKILLDQIFGRESFLNEIIWAYDYGARSKKKWSAKHDNILWYVKNPNEYIFNYDEIERIPYMAPGLVGEEKAARGKTLTDTWWHTIVSPTGKEKTGYPTQKPLGILKRVVQVSSQKDATVLDFFAGSGTTGEAALRLKRKFILIDSNPESLEVMAKRFAGYDNIEFINYEPRQHKFATEQSPLFDPDSK